MGFVRRFFGGTTKPDVQDSGPIRREPFRPLPTPDKVTVLGGGIDLEVVGESQYQEELWRAAGTTGPSRERVRVEIQAVLVAEPQNSYDPNAVAIQIGGDTVGYLSRFDAEHYRSGLLALKDLHGGPIALHGVIVGGGLREDGYGRLGVFLRHSPADFGLRPPPIPSTGKRMDTGLSDALATDAEDETYDLGWATNIPNDPLRAIPVLKKLLNATSSPIERHFIYHHLQEALYRCRAAFPSALDEFDECCKLHDGEMDNIRLAFLAKWEEIPRLQLYAQMCIRQAKKQDFSQALWWAERGLAVYGSSAARVDWVEDLSTRAATYREKLAPRPPATRRSSARTASIPASEKLVCSNCGNDFERQRVRGRKPTACPGCRDARVGDSS